MNKIMLIGAGGHGRVVLEALTSLGIKPFGFYDDNMEKGRIIDGIEVKGTILEFMNIEEEYDFVVCIGKNSIRKTLFERMKEKGKNPLTVIHPKAYVTNNAVIGEGTVVCAGAIVSAGAVIGENCIINTNCSIDHECIIQNHSQVQPGAVLTGNVLIGEMSIIGSGAIIIPGIKIGEKSFVGAGAVVTKNLEPGKVWVGVPAKYKRDTKDVEI